MEAAAELWRRSTIAVGVDKRDHVWDHPDFIPSAEHLENPAAFIDGLLDDESTDDFDAEFAKLEEMLRNGETGVSEDDEAKKAQDSETDPSSDADKKEDKDNKDGESGPSDSSGSDEK